ncbi:phosphoribosyl-ATP pyrophosphohydrolase [Thermanaerosceptrum fracticalcis]|uniref:Phosphoribosyl-ATP pyrophosphohydrolase n=1 Tax=Thermanaerosceptrum fracticalcis TaxID=1712410 RepID=A0A7G6E3Q5_THEFR|nr:nucleoside triphosphate pyrophosphohydrolase [Thermanaerosceptrum fracticalcis]QNB46709.1 phosphoribosyl-ATP pyrophosphohydrolase [Thermanaerosceptrum fracticalcis]
MATIKYDKLVRDRIPEIIEMTGKKAIIEKLDEAIYKKLLDEKLGEELQEYICNDNVEELADIVEVIYAILDYKKVTIEEFERIRLKKAEERGGFKERLLLKEVIEELE